ncbi:RagB/SusD family nutrient uptake outer membrane protein [Chitinophaga silvatica]|uniref:RagB/SusD family nutrient uptake outer membrane protein n=1 Tax=Chitinophaga silvatica TaxID=2282649 RepID=A0A3E1YBB1_9BACT|nr:RagB/SusD family nutrient uptake outer membrane protein [Chitinophaga silvatica]RFS23342.1 RagB/SusD family nutrient uptake outer membrane protein [Chitinophaga silvatica]
MKKKTLFKYIAGALLACAATTACNKNFLERSPLNEYKEADVWKDVGLVQGFVNDLYVQMRSGFEEVMLSSLTDESLMIHGYSTAMVVQGNMIPDDIGRLGDFARWDNHYQRIRNCNMFFEKIDQVPFSDESKRTRLKGEVHFMRAWYYHMLVKYYGGVPLITKSFNIKGDDQEILNVKRAPFADCIKFISDECDSAAKLLPLTYTLPADKGRVTMGAALALKSRMLLYAASDMFNDAPSPLQGYIGADRADLWKKARDAAKAVMDLNIYELYQPSGNPTESYSRIFLDKDHKELIFVKQYDKALLGTSHDKYNGPNGYHNWGGNVPLENFVSGYQMADGSTFSWNNAAQAKAPYVNRDPRFYATILYDGAQWKPRPTDGAAIDPKGVIQTGKYEPVTGKDSIWGLDTRGGTIENWNGTYSGYYLRKFMDKTLDAQFFNGDQSWIFFRYAEILLNYAEACIQIGGADEANGRTKLNEVRTRAGMPATNAAGTAALMAVLKYERRYELAFEEHRFFDVRRWKDADVVFNTNALGIEVLGSFIPGHPFTYRPYSIQDRAFPAGKYLAPIPASEIRKNSNLKQQSYYQ